ncbi:MAG: flagellar basal-body rod protein FlgG [bacterium]
MIRALHTAATGLDAQQLEIDNITNNLANVNTTGFKRARAEFQDLLYENLTAPGTQDAAGTETPTGTQIGHGVRTVAIRRFFGQGPVRNTGNPLDVTIDGDGFFQVTRPEGDIAYTRAGAFSLSSQGQLVTADGIPIEPSIQIPPDASDVTISADGTVSAMQPGQTTPTQLGQLTLARFANPPGLQAIGGNLFLETAASGAPTTGNPSSDGLGKLEQGFLEGSNVNVAEELVSMIVAQRAYEINSRTVRVADEMMQLANNMR